MGWFLTDSKAKKTASAKETTDNEVSGGSSMLVLGWCVVLIATAGLWAGAEQWLKPRIAGSATSVPLLKLNAPPWMPKELSDHLRASLKPHLSEDPYDQASLEAMAQTLGANPWVQRLDRVVRQADNTIHVHAQFRQPAAMVQSKRQWHLIDGMGYRLPNYASAHATTPSRALLKLSKGAITGIARPAPAIGQRWEGEDLSSALKLIAMLDRTDWAAQVRTIDATNHNGRKNKAGAHLVIQTHRGGWVLWGRAPGEEGVFEPAAELKLQNLERIRTAHDGHIDASGAGWIVDLTQDGTWIHPAR